jgi:hypothetical protein
MDAFDAQAPKTIGSGNARRAGRVWVLLPFAQAVMLVGVATALTLLLRRYTFAVPFAIYYVAVVIAAGYGSIAAGSVTIALRRSPPTSFFSLRTTSLRSGPTRSSRSVSSLPSQATLFSLFTACG